jgi:pimeloyl-ACP methyl ester carboxylesterase
LDKELVGLLSSPDAAQGAAPGVVLLHGFTSDRNEAPIVGTDETMFQRTAKGLTASGYFTFQFDFRGHGESGGRFEEITIDTLVADALAAVECLSAQPGVMADRIGLLGQSMGGLVAACAAHRDHRIRSAVLWNAPSHPLFNWTMLMEPKPIRVALAEGRVEFTWEDKGEFRLRRSFFESLIATSPLIEIMKFDGSLLVIVGSKDEKVCPQPQSGEAFIGAHQAHHELIVLEADHTFSVESKGFELLDRAIQATIDWFRIGL